MQLEIIARHFNLGDEHKEFIEAAVEAGFPRSDDFNGADQEGVGYYQLTARNGRRCSTIADSTNYSAGEYGRPIILSVSRLPVRRRQRFGSRYARWMCVRANGSAVSVSTGPGI